MKNPQEKNLIDELVWQRTVMGLALERLAREIEREKGGCIESMTLRTAQSVIDRLIIPDKPEAWSISDTIVAQRALDETWATGA